jgi:hypothetical protein
MPVDDRLFYWAREVRDAFEASEYAPEGAELWHWWWVPGSWMEVRTVLLPERSMMAVESGDLPDLPRPHEVRILPEITFTYPHSLVLPVARVGWSREARMVVMFMGQGGTLPDRRPQPPSMLDRLAHEGRIIRSIESLQRPAEWAQKIKDELGLNEGEEWKREKPTS